MKNGEHCDEGRASAGCNEKPTLRGTGGGTEMREFETMEELKLECLVDPSVELETEMVWIGGVFHIWDGRKWSEREELGKMLFGEEACGRK